MVFVACLIRGMGLLGFLLGHLKKVGMYWEYWDGNPFFQGQLQETWLANCSNIKCWDEHAAGVSGQESGIKEGYLLDSFGVMCAYSNLYITISYHYIPV